MKKFDNIEEFMSAAREEFSQEEPTFGHFNRFADKLDQLHQSKSPKKINFFKANQYLIAATVSIVLVSVFFFNKLNNNPHDFDAQTQHATELSSAYEDQNSYQVVGQDHSFSINGNYKEVAQTTKSFTELEMQYIELKQDFIEHQNEESLEAIKINLEQRLDLLNSAIESQKTAVHYNKRKANYDLLTKATDCFGLPQDDCNKYLGKQTSLYASN